MNTKKFPRNFRHSRRRGLVTLDYVMVTAVVFPLTVVLCFMLVRALKVLYLFASTVLSWPFL